MANYATSILITLLVLLLSPGSVIAQQEAYRGLEATGPSGEVIKLSPRAQDAIGLTVTEIEPRSLPMAIDVLGEVEAMPTRSFMQHALLTGRVANVFVNLGDNVKANQVLALLDSTAVNQMAAETLNTKTAIEAEIKKTRSQYIAEKEQANAKLELAQHNFDRMNTLNTEKIASKKATDSAKADLILAKSTKKNLERKMDVEIEALEAKLKITVQSMTDKLRQVGVSEDAIQKMLKTKHSILQVPVRTNRAGIVTKIWANPGEGVNNQDPLFEILDLDTVYAKADVYEGDMNRVKVGQQVKIRSTAHPKTSWVGRLSFVGSEIDPQKRTLAVRVRIANISHKLKPEMFVNMVIQTDEATRAILLPKTAVVEKNGHFSVFTEVKSGTYQLSVVKIGRSLGDDLEILSGLETGDRVVTRGTFQLDAHLLKKSGRTDQFAHPSDSHNHGDSTGHSGGGDQMHPLLIVLLASAFVLGCLLSLAITYFSGKGGSSSYGAKSDNEEAKIEEGDNS